MIQINYISNKEIPAFNTHGSEIDGGANVQVIVLYDDCTSISDRIINKDVLKVMEELYNESSVHKDIKGYLEKISTILSLKNLKENTLKEEIGNIIAGLADIDISSCLDIIKFIYAILQQQDTFNKRVYLAAMHEMILEECEAMGKIGDTETFAEHYGCEAVTEGEINGVDVNDKDESVTGNEEEVLVLDPSTLSDENE